MKIRLLMVRAPLPWIDNKNSKMPSPMHHATFIRVGMDWYITRQIRFFCRRMLLSGEQESVSAMYGKMDSLSRFVSSSGSSVPFLLVEPIIITQSP